MPRPGGVEAGGVNNLAGVGDRLVDAGPAERLLGETLGFDVHDDPQQAEAMQRVDVDLDLPAAVGGDGVIYLGDDQWLAVEVLDGESAVDRSRLVGGVDEVGGDGFGCRAGGEAFVGLAGGAVGDDGLLGEVAGGGAGLDLHVVEPDARAVGLPVRPVAVLPGVAERDAEEAVGGGESEGESLPVLAELDALIDWEFAPARGLGPEA